MVGRVGAVVAIHRNDDGSPNVITYLFTDNSGNRIAELPLTGVNWSYALNAAGTFTGTLSVEDPRVQAVSWIAATAPNLAQLWVDVNGALVWGGRVTTRNYDLKTGKVTVTGADHFSYLQQRLQAKDYSTQWSTTQTGAAQIAHTVVADALAVANSLSFNLSTPAATPTILGIYLSAPRQQRMSVDQLLTMMAELGFNVGFDFAVDSQYVAGVPTATLTLSYPRRGRIAGSTGLLLNVDQCLAFTYSEDGTQQANQVAQVSATGGLADVGNYPPSMTVDGYPLLEQRAIHTMFSAGNTPATVLKQFAQDDLALWAYPVTTPQITMPMFSEPALGEWIVGDDIRVLIPPSAAVSANVTQPFDNSLPFDNQLAFNPPILTSNQGRPANPRFPNGMDFYWRITKASCTPGDQGIGTTQFTFNMPPSTSPQRPPQ